MTEPFQGLAERFAANLGSPAYPTVMVPHPVAGKDAEGIERLARSIVDHVVARLTT